MPVSTPEREAKTADTLGEITRLWGASDPHRTAIRFNGTSITYQVLDQRVNEAAALLLQHGIERGDRVALMLPNCPEMLIFDLGCFRLGAVAVPINTRYQRAEVRYALEHSGAAVLVADCAFLPVVEGLAHELPDLRQMLIRNAPAGDGRDLTKALAGVTATAVTNAAHPEDAAVIFYTSGSTARPKGVVHSHRSLLGACRCQQTTRRMAPGRRWLVTTGIGYVAGLAGISLPCLYAGATILIEEDIGAEHLLRTIVRERAQASILLPTKLFDMLESPRVRELDLSSLEQVYVGGDECSHDLYHRFRDRFGYDLAQFLGMTECEGYVTNQSDADNRIGSIGRPADGVELRLVDDAGRTIDDDRAGEMLVRAPGMMVRYWNNPEATADTLADGWLRTGDVARRDADGYHWFIERRREIIIRDGSNIAPHEIEDVIDSHPAVAESCVVGVPDAHHGAVPVAYVELEPDAGPMTGETLAAWLEPRLSYYKIPTRWEFLAQLPRTATGKMNRKQLHARALNNSSSGDVD